MNNIQEMGVLYHFFQFCRKLYNQRNWPYPVRTDTGGQPKTPAELKQCGAECEVHLRAVPKIKRKIGEEELRVLFGTVGSPVAVGSPGGVC